MIYNETKYNNSWNVKKLSDLGIFSRGKSKHRPRNDKLLFEGGGYPLIQTGDIKEANLYVNNHTVEYNDFGLKQSKLWDKGTLCITIAANIAETAILKYPMCFPDSIVGFNAYPEESSEKFMHYVFTFIKQSIQKASIGSIQDNINLEYLQQLEFRIPEKKYQEKIVDILGSIDEQIENLNKINNKLEKILKLIYEYVFIQQNGFGISADNFETIKLGDIVKKDKVSYDANKIVDVIDLSVMESSKISLSSVNSSVNFNSNLFELKKGDILFGSIRPYLKKACISPIDGAYAGTVFNIKPKNIMDYNYILGTVTSERIFDFAMKVSKGTKMPVVGYDDLMEYEIPYNAEASKILSDFPIRDIVCNNSKKIIELKKMRDNILPLLMTGQINLKEVE